jgi:hypothetical protein
MFRPGRSAVAATESDRQAVKVPLTAFAVPGVGATLIDHVLPTDAILLPAESVITDDEFAGIVPLHTNDAAVTDFE